MAHERLFILAVIHHLVFFSPFCYGIEYVVTCARAYLTLYVCLTYWRKEVYGVFTRYHSRAQAKALIQLHSTDSREISDISSNLQWLLKPTAWAGQVECLPNDFLRDRRLVRPLTDTSLSFLPYYSLVELFIRQKGN